MNKWIFALIGLAIGFGIAWLIWGMKKNRQTTPPGTERSYSSCPPGENCAGYFNSAGQCVGQCVKGSA